MGDKFIPNSDVKFSEMAFGFASVVTKDPARCAVSRADADVLAAAVARYRDAHQAAYGGARSPRTTREKTKARAEAERIIRRLAHLIRASDGVDPAVKVMLGLRERPANAKHQACPVEPPRLSFVRALHEGNGATPVHELRFSMLRETHKSRPPGAVRLELFVDLVAPDEPIPAHPGANYGGRPWYLRSYTRTPIKLIPPIARVPMRVVYWGRWADSTGNVGPFSATAVGWIEGGTHHSLPGGVGMGTWGKAPVPILEESPTVGPAYRERTYVVAVLEAQYQSIAGPTIAPASLPAPEEREQRQLEAPAENEAAEAA